MNTFILLMIFTTGEYRAGITVVQQEFDSRATCNVARLALAKAHDGSSRVLVAQGCFKK